MKRKKRIKSIVLSGLFLLPFLTHLILPIRVIVTKPFSYLGILFMFAGITITVKSARMFKTFGNHFDLNSQSESLMTSGIFSVSRNPMYLGVLFWLIGLAFLLGSLISFLYPAIFFVLAHFMIRYEEAKLFGIYGEDFVNYKRKVRRWL